ncbi:hypothetical protein N7533_003698 [Penicillium manginii]|jgi:hypothetical protein|uniref:uncharacterized protein n=1 Tax=Penicillium manginii TaxID=203109 RepID=UPI002549A7E2|nr:uncharacterized protein N7533_003698 [Penicillium manginii]KAJ5761659.1 hypothetical protein N7533_003698 [Penicillium manginii]
MSDEYYTPSWRARIGNTDEAGERRQWQDAHNSAHRQKMDNFYNLSEGVRARDRGEREMKDTVEQKREWVAARQAERREWRLSELTPT